MKIFLSAIFLAGLAASVQATPTIYFAEAGAATGMRSSFLSGLTGVGNESFETFAINEILPLTPMFSGTNTGQLSGVGCVSENSGDCGTDVGSAATSGTQYFKSIGEFNVALNSPISAFGFYGTDIGDFNNRLWIDLTDTSGVVVYSFEVNHSLGENQNRSLLFWGFKDDVKTYSKIGFRNVDPDNSLESFGFDDMVVGNIAQACTSGSCNVPEPASLALLGLGLVGLVATRRRKESTV